ncbi:hypothetical protein E2C01_101697 [Portunus trituberculatus]|uniref:Uncharacterized protein n=1 Tax=Portunus trituberculatus TaxID=210409 RepID=A0A5B7KMJ8_PORTR|nr:hypothetical protein [Portunus trituberculatus]
MMQIYRDSEQRRVTFEPAACEWWACRRVLPSSLL